MGGVGSLFTKYLRPTTEEQYKKLDTYRISEKIL